MKEKKVEEKMKNEKEPYKTTEEKKCYYLLDDGMCGVTMPRMTAECPCEDYTTEPDAFWELCKRQKNGI